MNCLVYFKQMQQPLQKSQFQIQKLIRYVYDVMGGLEDASKE